MAANLQQKHANFITRSVYVAQQFKAAYDAWVALREEWDAQSYGAGGTAIVDSDFSGSNAFLVASDLQAFYVSQGNLATYWASGNSTNITKMIP